jgi:hypothetical protein
MKNRTLLIVAALLFAITPMVAGITATSTNLATDSKSASYCGVSADEIYSYMSRQNIQVTSIMPITDSCNVIVKASSGKLYIVYISDGIIEGHEEWNG